MLDGRRVISAERYRSYVVHHLDRDAAVLCRSIPQLPINIPPPGPKRPILHDDPSMSKTERHRRNAVHHLDGNGAALSRTVSELPMRIVTPHPERPIALDCGGITRTTSVITNAQRNGNNIVHYLNWNIVAAVVSRPVAQLAMRIVAPHPERSVALDCGGMQIAERNADNIVHDLCGSESMRRSHILVANNALIVPTPHPKLPVIFDGSRIICSESNARYIVHKLVRIIVFFIARRISELKFRVAAPDPKLPIRGDSS